MIGGFFCFLNYGVSKGVQTEPVSRAYEIARFSFKFIQTVNHASSPAPKRRRHEAPNVICVVSAECRCRFFLGALVELKRVNLNSRGGFHQITAERTVGIVKEDVHRVSPLLETGGEVTDA